MNEFRAYHLPGIKESEISRWDILEFNTLQVKVPLLTPQLLQKHVRTLIAFQKNYLQKTPINEVLSTLGDIIEKWRNPNFIYRKKAEIYLPITTGYSKEVINEGITVAFENWKPEKFEKLLILELGNPKYLDGFQKYANQQSRVLSPSLIFHFFAGNIPTPPVLSIIHSLIVKASVFGKMSSGNMIFPVLFAQSISDLNPDLANCLGLVWWKHDNTELENVLFDASDVITIAGTDGAVNRLNQRISPTKRVLRYGHKISIGIISRETLYSNNIRSLAKKAVYDICLYDQQGCLSPQMIFIEKGGNLPPEKFAEVLSQEFEAVQNELPGRELSLEEKIAIREIRDTMQFKKIGGESIQIWTSNSTSNWTVIYENNLKLHTFPLNRVIFIQPFESLESLISFLRPLSRVLSTVGYSLSQEKIKKIIPQFLDIGVSRICPIGQMQKPSLLWHHDGYGNISDYVKWVDWEI